MSYDTVTSKLLHTHPRKKKKKLLHTRHFPHDLQTIAPEPFVGFNKISHGNSQRIWQIFFFGRCSVPHDGAYDSCHRSVLLMVNADYRAEKPLSMISLPSLSRVPTWALVVSRQWMGGVFSAVRATGAFACWMDSQRCTTLGLMRAAQRFANLQNLITHIVQLRTVS